MKVGDVFPVSLEGHAVAEALIENIEDGVATLIIPATRVQVKVRQTLDVEHTPAPEVDRVFGGLTESPGEVVSEASADVNGTPAPTAARPTPAPPSAVGDGIHNVVLDSSAID